MTTSCSFEERSSNKLVIFLNVLASFRGSAWAIHSMCRMNCLMVRLQPSFLSGVIWNIKFLTAGIYQEQLLFWRTVYTYSIFYGQSIYFTVLVVAIHLFKYCICFCHRKKGIHFSCYFTQKDFFRIVGSSYFVLITHSW